MRKWIGRLLCRWFGHTRLETEGERLRNGHLKWRCTRCGTSGSLMSLLEDDE